MLLYVTPQMRATSASGAERRRREGPPRNRSAFSPPAVNSALARSRRNRDRAGSIYEAAAPRAALRASRGYSPPLARSYCAPARPRRRSPPHARASRARFRARVGSRPPPRSTRARASRRSRASAAPRSTIAPRRSPRWRPRARLRRVPPSARGLLRERAAALRARRPRARVIPGVGRGARARAHDVHALGGATKGPPEPFETESDGDCEVTLTRAYGDDERSPPPQRHRGPLRRGRRDPPAGADEGDEDEDEDVAIHFLVSALRCHGEEALELLRHRRRDGGGQNVRYESLADGLETTRWARVPQRVPGAELRRARRERAGGVPQVP